MGEVYRATDTRLDRTVAIKVLPEHFASDPQRRERFEREAKAVSSLNHPHICTLHDVGEQDGIHYLVMELVEGDTLAARLEKGRLPLDQALEYAIQIADALDKAHRQGVVHRDLKPGNIMLTKSAGVKLLDFGLAKLRVRQEVTPLSEMTTAGSTQPLTANEGAWGTLRYMSPQQLQGERTDARTDIWAFGCVLYEMLTARKAFDGDTRPTIIAAILEREPLLLTDVRSDLPESIEHLINRCLDKDAAERWQSIHDLMLDLRWLGGRHRLPDRQPGSRLAVPLTLALTLLVVAMAVYLARYALEPEVSGIQTRYAFTIPLPEGIYSAWSRTLSPNGEWIAFMAMSDGGNAETTNLWLYNLDSQRFSELPRDEVNLANPAEIGVRMLFWAPDSQRIAYFTDQQLRTVDIASGRAVTIAEIEFGSSSGGSWNEEGQIIFSTGDPLTIYRVSETGGTPESVVVRDLSLPYSRSPHFLPDGHHFIYLESVPPQELEPGPSQGSSQFLCIGTLDADPCKRVDVEFADFRSIYAAPGYIVSGGTDGLVAYRFDAETLNIVGGPQPITGSGNFEDISVSNNGLLVADRGLAGTPASTWREINIVLNWFEELKERVPVP